MIEQLNIIRELKGIIESLKTYAVLNKSIKRLSVEAGDRVLINNYFKSDDENSVYAIAVHIKTGRIITVNCDLLTVITNE